MGNTTPNRGYRYPLSTATMAFPAQIQELATDINNDVGALETFINGAYVRPSGHVLNFVTPQSVPASTTTSLTFAGGATDYALGMTPNLAAAGGLTLTVAGVYLVSGFIAMTAPGSGSTFTLQLSMHSSKAFLPTLVRQTIRAHATRDTWLHISAMHYNDGVGADNLRMDMWQNSAGARSVTSRHMTATKISNIPGGS